MKTIEDLNQISFNVQKEMAEVAGFLWQRGWAERNAGNMSVNITGKLGEYELEWLNYPQKKLEKRYPELNDNFLLVTTSGSRMRDVSKNPSENIRLLQIVDNGSQLQIYQEKNGKVFPTSELPTHLAVHQFLVQQKAEEKAVLHTHVNELIALTHIAGYQSEAAINDLIWKMHPETQMFLPEGIGYVPFEAPGTEDLAQVTVKALEKHRVVIWEKHGCFATGKDINQAFDNIDLVVKSIRIFFMCRMAGYHPEGCPSLSDIDK